MLVGGTDNKQITNIYRPSGDRYQGENSGREGRLEVTGTGLKFVI